MSLELAVPNAVEAGVHHPLFIKGALLFGGVFLAIGATRFALRKIGVIAENVRG